VALRTCCSSSSWRSGCSADPCRAPCSASSAAWSSTWSRSGRSASLILTLAGFWAGRYAETTGRGRLAPVIAAGTITVLAGGFGYFLHFLLDQEVAARHALLTALVPAVLLNVALALPVHALVRKLVGEGQRELAPEVEVLV
jgi:hypothetical protein